MHERVRRWMWVGIAIGLLLAIAGFDPYRDAAPAGQVSGDN
jgi:purine-cytosine permease-like protein